MSNVLRSARSPRSRWSLALSACGAVAHGAQAGAPAAAAFPTADAAADAMTDALRKNDDKAIGGHAGRELARLRAGHAGRRGQARARIPQGVGREPQARAATATTRAVEVGTTGFMMPIPIVKEAERLALRRRGRPQGDRSRAQIGRNELTVVQTPARHRRRAARLRRARSDEDRHDGLCAPAAELARQEGRPLLGEPSPASRRARSAPLVAKAQTGDVRGQGYYGYHYRLLYGQGPTRRAAPTAIWSTAA